MAEQEFSSGGVVAKKIPSGFVILLIKDSYGRWTWPKGHIENGETPPQAAEREIGEETGLKDIKLVEGLDKIQYSFGRGRGRISKTVYLYLFEATGIENLKALKGEIESAEWFSPEEALERIEYKGAKEVLKRAVDRFREICNK
ncbi:MAG: NUDIX hydrolase [Candidatus Omnitrophica bacterium]|nr:NUDIX hydrolase [Candidatus Omnitrophota bacterium]